MSEPEKEQKATGELVKIEGTRSCSAFYADTQRQHENYVKCRGKRGEVTLYTGKNYKYFATATEDTEGCEVYADDKLIVPQYDEGIQMSVYEIGNCEELRFEFSEALTLSEAWVYKTVYPTAVTK